MINFILEENKLIFAKDVKIVEEVLRAEYCAVTRTIASL